MNPNRLSAVNRAARVGLQLTVGSLRVSADLWAANRQIKGSSNDVERVSDAWPVSADITNGSAKNY